MTMNVAVGQAFSVEGREAVSKAIYDARLVLENAPIHFAILIVSIEYDFHDISVAAKSQLGDVPVIGFSTSSEITQEGSKRRSVVAALISDETLEAEADWRPGMSESSRSIAERVIKSLGIDKKESGLLLLVADGLSEEYDELLGQLPIGKFAVAGCMAGGDLLHDRTFQLGGDKSGSNGLAAAFLSSPTLRFGIGVGHGWQSIGANFRVTQSRDNWVRSLDGKPASEGYAALFGRPARDWGFPPLNSIVRLYPLGIERDDRPMRVHSPLRVEPDGSLRMSTPIPDGLTGHLLVGSRERCLEAARKATGDALYQMEGAQPKLAIVFADIAWEMLFQGYASAEVEAIRDVLGDEVPIIGGYSFGQIAQRDQTSPAVYLNQHVEVVVIGEE